MAESRQRQLSSRRLRKATVSKKSLFFVLLAGLALNVCPLITFYTDANNPDLCFVNWWNLMYTGYCFVKLITALIRSSVRQSVLRYGLLRVIMCVLFITLFSYFVVAVALDKAALVTWDAFESNFIKKFEENVVTINETRTEFTVREIRGHEPLKLEKHMRYIGEDVRLVCEDNLYFERRVKFDKKQIIWKHNKLRIESSSRYHIKTIFEEIPKNDTMKLVEEIWGREFYMYKLESTLDIYLIEKEEFGKYSCYVAKQALSVEMKNSSNYTSSRTDDKRQDKSSSQDGATSQAECPVKQEDRECPCPPWEILRMMRLRLFEFNPFSYAWNAEFLVQKINPNRRIVSVPIGSIVSASASYIHLDDRGIEFDHEINGKTFVETCNGLDQACSVLIYIYWFMWHDGGHFTFMPAFYERLQMVEGIGGTSWQCVCPYTYGLHKFMFYRQIYNSTLNRYQIVSIAYPDTIELVPEEPNILDPYYNGSKETFALPEPSCWGNMATTVCLYLERILNTIACDFFFKEKVYLLCGMIICLSTSVLLSKLVLVWITNPCINWILGRNRLETIQTVEVSGTLAGLANLKNTVLKYDVFISCAQEQNDVALDLADYLQTRGLRVSLLDIDVLGNEITTQGLSRLITESWKFVVIVTPHYVNSGLQNSFEIQLILQRLHDGFVSEDNIALISSDPILIPDHFNNNFAIFDWPRDHFTDVFEHVRNWIGPSIFPSHFVTRAQIIRKYQLMFSSVSLLSFSCFCFCSLYLILTRGKAM